ncbi:MAG: TIGR03960 family B12-binding radical SAM protein [Coriobacteriia bacterium]|nr:TIGR03960 family B12-binding radical SAM protein [Coriobacteriia bacterium]
MSSVWERLEPLLASVERPTRYIDAEWGAVRGKDSSYRAALLYPDTYEIGMANQGLAILYERLNALEDTAAERVYLPWLDMIDAMRREAIPLFSLETSTPVREFDLFGITLPYELTYSNILEAIDLAGLPLRAAYRSDADPLVIGGGPCVYNPEPVAPFFDAILIGEGEDAIVDIVDEHRLLRDSGATRAETLAALACIPGVYVPSLPATQGPVAKRVVEDLGAVRPPTCPVVPYMDVVHDRVAVEVLRGCTRGCRFCQAGMVYRPVRERDADSVVRDALAGLRCTGYDEVSLTSLSTTDHSQLEEILRRLGRRLEGSGVSVSLPSLRVDAFSVEMARLVAGSGRKSGLTFAPEAGTQRLRDVINKNVSEEDLVDTVRVAFASGWRRVKLYFMIGLPTETDDDIAGIGAITQRVLDVAKEATPKDQRGAIRISVSVSTLVPKAHTPFQWQGQISRSEINRRQRILRESMPRKGIDLSWHDADVSVLEAALARGGREVADGIEAAWRSGARFDAWTERFSIQLWTEAFSSAGLDIEEIAVRSYEVGADLPWFRISAGVSQSYLAREWERAVGGLLTGDCSFDTCTGCGVCGDSGLGVETVLGGEARGSR